MRGFASTMDSDFGSMYLAVGRATISFQFSTSEDVKFSERLHCGTLFSRRTDLHFGAMYLHLRLPRGDCIRLALVFDPILGV